MENTLELIILPDSRVQTNITFFDKSEILEIHDKGRDDETVIMRIVKSDFYRGFKGPWKIHLPADKCTFEGDDLPTAAQKVLAFINERDNPNIYVINYF